MPKDIHHPRASSAVYAMYMHDTITVTHYNKLQHAATRCNTLQHTATYRNTPQHTATHRNTPQHTATQANAERHSALALHLRAFDDNLMIVL